MDAPVRFPMWHFAKEHRTTASEQQRSRRNVSHRNENAAEPRRMVRPRIAALFALLLLTACYALLSGCSSQQTDVYVRVMGTPSDSAEIEPMHINVQSSGADYRPLADDTSVPNDDSYTLVATKKWSHPVLSDGVYLKVTSAPVFDDGSLYAPSLQDDAVFGYVASRNFKFSDGRWQSLGEEDGTSFIASEDESALFLTINMENWERIDLTKEWLSSQADTLKDRVETHVGYLKKQSEEHGGDYEELLEQETQRAKELDRTCAKIKSANPDDLEGLATLYLEICQIMSESKA